MALRQTGSTVSRRHTVKAISAGVLPLLVNLVLLTSDQFRSILLTSDQFCSLLTSPAHFLSVILSFDKLCSPVWSKFITSDQFCSLVIGSGHFVSTQVCDVSVEKEEIEQSVKTMVRFLQVSLNLKSLVSLMRKKLRNKTNKQTKTGNNIVLRMIPLPKIQQYFYIL